MERIVSGYESREEVQPRNLDHRHGRVFDISDRRLWTFVALVYLQLTAAPWLARLPARDVNPPQIDAMHRHVPAQGRRRVARDHRAVVLRQGCGQPKPVQVNIVSHRTSGVPPAPQSQPLPARNLAAHGSFIESLPLRLLP